MIRGQPYETSTSRTWRRGVALMSTLVLIAVLAGIVLEMTRRLQTGRRTTQQLAARLQIERLQRDLRFAPDRKPPETLVLPGGLIFETVGEAIVLRTESGTVITRRLIGDAPATDTPAADDPATDEQDSPE